jgi:hypothetical protein
MPLSVKLCASMLHGFPPLGFELTEITLEGSPRLSQFPVFHYLNKQTGMRFHISFFAAKDGLNGGFTILIIKPVNRKLNVEDYLKRRERNELTSFFTYPDAKTDVRKFANNFLQMFCKLLDTDLKPIIDGQTFEETPIDWQGYK